MRALRANAALVLGVVLVLGAAWVAGWAIASVPHLTHVDPFDPANAVPYLEEAR